MGFGNMQSGGGSVSWTDITGKPLEFAPLMGNLGNVLFVSPTGNSTQTRATGVGRIDKPFTLARAVAVHQSNDTIFVLGNIGTDFAAITINNTAATTKNLNFVLCNASILNLTITNTGGGTFNVYLDKIGAGQVSRIHSQLVVSGNNIQLQVKDVVIGECVVSGNNNLVEWDSVISSSGLNISGSGSTIRLQDCGTALQASNTLLSLDVSGGFFAGIFSAASIFTSHIRIHNARYGGANMLQLTNSTATLGGKMELVNCWHYYPTAGGFLIEMSAVTTWTDATKFIKMIYCSATGTLENSDPSITPQIDKYHCIDAY
jgi:hypothetical protein